MSQNFTPLLPTKDWNEEWKELQKVRRRFDNAEFWDKRSKTFSTKDAPNTYVNRFIELMGIRPNETVFDMGCGTGALSAPLGQAGHKVVAADFSQGMLDVLHEELETKGIKTVFPKLMSWEDDWESFGVREGMVDFAIASRSIATSDLKESLKRLTEIARRRVCITLATGSSPRMDEKLLSEIGVKNDSGNDYLYAFNILVNEGIKPEISYIESTRTDTFDDVEDAYEEFSRMVFDALSDKESPETAAALGRLRDWLDVHLIENPEVGAVDRKGVPQKRFKLDKQRRVTWAFMAWDTDQAL